VQTQIQSRMAGLLPDSVLAPASAVACPETKPGVSLGGVSPGDTVGPPRRGELVRIVAAVVRVVAEQGKIEAEPLLEKVVMALPSWARGATAGPEEVAAWANETAIALGGSDIAHQRALEVAECKDFAKKAGLLPKEVAEAVRDKWAEQDSEEFETAKAVRTWAGVVAKHYIIDHHRHREVEGRVEKIADQVLPLFHATVPFAPVPTPIELRDVLRQALIVGINLESRKTKPKRQLGRRWKARRRKNLLAVQFWLQFLASIFEVPLGDAAELAELLETTPGTIYTNRVKIQVKVLALQRAGKIDLEVRSKRPKSESTPKREPRN
jgi:hypothetical protein